MSAILTHHSSQILEGNLHQFFSELLVGAAEHQKLSISPNATKYVTDLLVAFHETAALFAQEGVRLPVLADMLSEALDADFHRRVSLLRQMGDTSLMVSGFFPEALARRSLDIHYYQRMGEIAYSNLSTISVETSVYSELSQRFINLSHLLNEVSEQIHAKNYPVSKLVEFYTATGSEYILDQLKQQGVIPLSVKTRGEDRE